MSELAQLAYPDVDAPRRRAAHDPPPPARRDGAARAARAARDGHAHLAWHLQARRAAVRGRPRRPRSRPAAASLRSHPLRRRCLPRRRLDRRGDAPRWSSRSRGRRRAGLRSGSCWSTATSSPSRYRRCATPSGSWGRRFASSIRPGAERRAADRGVPFGLVPRGTLRDVARTAGAAWARPGGAQAALSAKMIDMPARRSPPGRPTSWPWEWIAPTAAPLPRRPPRRASGRSRRSPTCWWSSSGEVAAC